MSYNYTSQRKELFTEEGVKILFKIRDEVTHLLSIAGACTADKAMASCTGDTWTMLAALDYMIEMKEIREVTGAQVWAQHRVFVKAQQ